MVLDDTDLADLIPPIRVGNGCINIRANLIVGRLNVCTTTRTGHRHVVRLVVQPGICAGTELQMAGQIRVACQIQAVLRGLPLCLDQVIATQ